MDTQRDIQKQDFERLGRARKVAKILSVIPAGQTRDANDMVARILLAASEIHRAGLARRAGVNPPSALTWAAVIDAVRNREVAS